MLKQMVGDTTVVVIDEIGEVTFCHDIMKDSILPCSDLETLERTLAAVVVMLVVAERIVGVSIAGAKIQSAKESLLANSDWHIDRLAERVEFSKHVRQG